MASPGAAILALVVNGMARSLPMFSNSTPPLARPRSGGVAPGRRRFCLVDAAERWRRSVFVFQGGPRRQPRIATDGRRGRRPAFASPSICFKPINPYIGCSGVRSKHEDRPLRARGFAAMFRSKHEDRPLRARAPSASSTKRAARSERCSAPSTNAGGRALKDANSPSSIAGWRGALILRSSASGTKK